MEHLKLKFKIWLENEEHKGILGDGKCNLLKTIHETGSLKEAMQIHGLTYRKTWDNLNKIEQMLGFQIIERQRGGSSGGKTVLTEKGQAIVKVFDDFHTQYDQFIAQVLEQSLQHIKQI